MTLELDSYELANLLWLLRVAQFTELNTGDWCKQIRLQIEAGPNVGPANGDDFATVATLISERSKRNLQLREERDQARYNARLLAFAYKNDVTPGLAFNRAVDASLAYPVKP